MTHFGWDASNHDWSRGPMDLNAAVAAGVEFFTHKATEGTTYRDPYLGEALKRARASRLAWFGTYFVPRTPGNGGNGTVSAQVDYYLAYLDEAAPWWRTEPRFRVHQVDTEHWGDYDAVSPSIGAGAAATVGNRGTGRLVLHYAPRWAYGDMIPGTEPLWASAYGKNPAVPLKQGYPGDAAWPAPYSGRTPKVWQFGSRLTIGTQPQCDGDAIADEAFWQLLIGGDELAGEGPEILQRVKEMQECYKDITPGKTGGRNALTYWLRRIGLGEDGPGLPQVSERLDKIEGALSTLAANPPGTVTVSDDQLERVLRKVIGSVDGS